MIKLVYNSKNKIVKHERKTFEQLRNIIKNNFQEVPQDYSLSYLDEDNDQICLNSDEDLVNMLHANRKLHKVYIKQSLSQTVVLDLERSDFIEPSFEEENDEEKNDEGKKEEVREEGKKEEVREEGKKQEVREEGKKQEVREEGKQEEVREEGKQEEVNAFVKKTVKIVDIMDEVEAKVQSRPSSEIQVVQKLEQQPVAQKQEVKETEVKEEEAKDAPECPKNDDLLAQIVSEAIEIVQEVPRDNMEISQVIQIMTQPVCRSKIEAEKLQIKPSAIVLVKVEPNELIGAAVPKRIGQPLKIEPPQMSNIGRAEYFDSLNSLNLQKKVQREQELLVHHVMCSTCRDEFGIMGIRYQCILCDNFNICSNCQQTDTHKHSLVKVKKPELAITKSMIIQRYRKEMQPEKGKALPAGHYVPSISHEEAKTIYVAAKEAMEQGMERSKRLMDDMFYKVSMSHKNPYLKDSPAPPRVDTIFEKTKYLYNIVGGDYATATKFVQQYPTLSSAEITERYFQLKN